MLRIIELSIQGDGSGPAAPDTPSPPEAPPSSDEDECEVDLSEVRISG